MYVPPHFSVTDLPALQAAIERYSFALLVSTAADEPIASHLPLLLDREAGQHGTLVGHMARANRHWQHASGQTAMAVFSGPHAYISPRWYSAERVVPTWNYVAVHAYGRLNVIDDLEETIELLQRTVAHYEVPLPEPWKFDAPADFVAGLARQVVAFRMPIERLEGKWKLNQNHSADRRQSVAEALERREEDNSWEIARLIRETL